MPESRLVVFGALDRGAEIEVSARNLPHWFQIGTAMFITFRTADSLPKEVVARMTAQLTEWLQQRSLPADLAESIFGPKRQDHPQLIERLDWDQRRELRVLTERLFHRALDSCHGECLLRQPQLSQLVADAIRKFDGDRYDLDSLVVMPNHVHVLVQFRQEHGLKIISQSWLRYTARLINQQLGRRGVFWQPEPFDHLVRSPEQFQSLRQYLAENPSQAQLSSGEYHYWRRM